MLQTSKLNNVVTVTYNSANFKSSVTVQMEVIDESNLSILGSPFTMTEIVNTGVYAGTFTPATLGTYKIIILEAGNPVTHGQIQITNYDIDTVGQIVSNISPPGSSQGGNIV